MQSYCLFPVNEATNVFFVIFRGFLLTNLRTGVAFLGKKMSANQNLSDQNDHTTFFTCEKYSMRYAAKYEFYFS